MPEYVVGSYIRSPAARRFRLVNFDASFAANGYKLKQRHCEELDKLLQFVSQTTSFSYWLIGFASKTGPAADNQQLSNNRALAVEKYLSARNPAFADPDRLQKFQGVGEAGYQAAETDNSWEYRAVEVHLFIGDVKPPTSDPCRTSFRRCRADGATSSGKWPRCSACRSRPLRHSDRWGYR